MSPLFDSPLTAFAAGLVTSIHCVGMCGPLACAAIPRTGATAPSLLYHGGRLAAYTTLGAIGGWIGVTLAPLINNPAWKLLPISFALFFLVIAAGWDKKITPPRWLGALGAHLMRRAATLPKPAAGLLLGLGTPFLPCGPLYLALGISLFTGSALTGGSLMACFAFGTIPALLLLQLNWNWLTGKLSPTWLRNAQRSLALLAAIMVIWRIAAMPAFLSGGHCPLCH